jgi:hypothetical protein
MANIEVKDLTSIAGADLFNDYESFMQDLSESELILKGGGFWDWLGTAQWSGAGGKA